MLLGGRTIVHWSIAVVDVWIGPGFKQKSFSFGFSQKSYISTVFYKAWFICGNSDLFLLAVSKINSWINLKTSRMCWKSMTSSCQNHKSNKKIQNSSEILNKIHKLWKYLFLTLNKEWAEIPRITNNLDNQTDHVKNIYNNV